MVKQMSDPVSRDEVEDVLSSIRRLVSEEKRPMQVRPTSSPDGRLVLTPALRVAEQTEAGPLDLGSVAQDTWTEDDTTEAESPEWDEEADDHSLEAYWEENPPGTVPPRGDDTVTPDDATTDHEAMTDQEACDEADPDIDAHETGGPTDDTEATNAAVSVETSDSSALKLTAKIAALETAIGSIRTEFEPDEAGTDAYSGTDAPAMMWEDNVELDATGSPLKVVKIDETRDDEPTDEGTDTVDDTTDAPTPQPIEENADELIEEIADEALFEPEIPTAASEQLGNSDEDLVEPTAAVDAGRADPQDEPGQDGFFAEDQLIDEDALRDLVSNIVRSELQGALGERITRNVRKLVRREIHRALAAQELD